MNELSRTLKEIFHLSYLKPMQEAVILRIIENSRRRERSDSIIILPTGSGKSLCFMLPSVLLSGYTVILYPLRALMNDQAKRFEEENIAYAMIKGGMERKEKQDELNKLYLRKARILITNIESLIILMEQKRADFLIGNTELFVIDEAHTAVTWAESFRPSFQKLNEMTEIIKPHQRLCFTATADEAILNGLKRDVLKNDRAFILRLSSDRENIFYSAIRTLSRKRDICRILEAPVSRPALVFCSYRTETIEYYDIFKKTFPSFYYHAGLEKDEKVRIENEFLASSDGVMFATNAYGMGVDKKDIRTVIHLHAPCVATAFLQEAGRAGRDNKESKSIVLYSEQDKDGLIDIFKGCGCIRKNLLLLMGEEYSDNCDNCSACKANRPLAAGESAIRNTLRHFPLLLSENMLIKILKAKALRSWSEGEIRKALRILKSEKSIKSILTRLYLTRR